MSDPPPTPVASNRKEFVAWARAHAIRPFAEYSAYPGATALQIRSEADKAGIELDAAGAQQLPLLVIMPMKGPVSILAVTAAFQVLIGYLKKGGDAVGTVHFAHLVKLPHNQVGFFTIYDGPFDKYTQDFADQLGPAFDLLFRFTKNPPPTPTSKHAGPFSAWVKEHDLSPLAFYSGYPGLQVQDVKALLAAPMGSSDEPEVSDGHAGTARHPGDHRSRISHADGALLPPEGGDAHRGPRRAGAADVRRRGRRAPDHDRRGLARGDARTSRRSDELAEAEAGLLPQRRHHVARAGGAGRHGSSAADSVRILRRLRRGGGAAGGTSRRPRRQRTGTLGGRVRNG